MLGADPVALYHHLAFVHLQIPLAVGIKTIKEAIFRREYCLDLSLHHYHLYKREPED